MGNTKKVKFDKDELIDALNYLDSMAVANNDGELQQIINNYSLLRQFIKSK